MATSAFTSKNYKFDLFVSHRGPDVKMTPASCLYCWLTSYGLQVFLDYQELEEGLNLDTQIKEAIASASLHVVMFSPGYTDSTWCLEELHLMFESGKPIIPIFYEVKPADLGWAQEHRGAYAEALEQHGNKIAGNGQPRHNSTTVGKWRNALSRAAYISGFDLDTFNGDVGKLLDKVVKWVLERVKRQNLFDVGKHIFGLDEKAQDFHRKVLSQQHSGRVQVVGIAGPPGVGKTTLDKEVFNRNRSNYNHSYFLFAVRENPKSSLPSLQKKILKGLTRLNQDVDNVDEGKWMLQKHLSKSRVLLVLDDVDDVNHVDALLPVDVLHPESLVLITSRNTNVLKWSGIQEPSIYHLSGLHQHHSTQLFCFYAFGQPHPKSGFEYLVHQFLKDCNGVPLCLKECGRLVANNNNKSEWEDQLKKRRQTLHTDIPRSLQISSEIRNRSGSILDSVNTIGMHDHLRALSINLPWRGTEEINDLCHAMKVISHSSNLLELISLFCNYENQSRISMSRLRRIVLKSLAFEDEKSKRKLMNAIAGVEGVESVAVDVKEMKVIVIGSPDPVFLTLKLRKSGFGFTELLSVGPRPWRGIEEFNDLSHDMKKIVLKSLPFEDEKSKRRVMIRIAGVEGVESVAVDLKEMKITVIGSADPVYLTALLRKFGAVEMLSVGPARENKFRGSE